MRCGCIYDHYCSSHPTDKFFCWVRDETKAKNGEVAPDQYVPWNHNANLQIVELSDTDLRSKERQWCASIAGRRKVACQ